MIYIGSTLIPGRRFDNHLVSGKYSNPALQADLQQYGLDNFTVYILELVNITAKLNIKNKTNILRKVEQGYINKFPKKHLYNFISSFTS
jgi:group I intron endonuclease